MEPLDFERLDTLGREHGDAFARAEPFPHVVIDDFLPPDVADAVLEEFDRTEAGWNHYHHYNEKKLALTHLERMPPRTRELFDAFLSRRFVEWIEELTGIEGLVADPELDGAGLHKILRGGFLNVHTDFLSHTTKRHWSRQINLLLFLNKGWRPEWGGDLELWDSRMKRAVRSVAPVFNRCVIFHTTRKSFHGHPHPLACPPEESRRSLALYYFREESRRQDLRPTHYRPLPDDPLHKKLLVAGDRGLLRVYSALKRYTGLRDDVASRLLKRLR